jgi:hypothetical protein
MAKRDAFEELYKSKTGTAGWYPGLSPEAQQWVQDLTEYTRVKGRDPVWSQVLTRFSELFPDEAPKSWGTVAAAVRRLRG